MKKISQRHARWMQKRIDELERQRSQQRQRWASEWSASWVNIASLSLQSESFAKIKTARLLGHAVIVLPGNGTEVLLYAEKL